MLAFVLRRLMSMVIVMWLVATVVFVIFRLIPGDPAALLVGSNGTAEQLATMRHAMGLDRPLVIQYVTWLGGILRGDFGTAYVQGSKPVLGLIAGPLLHTTELAVASMVLALIIAVPLGVLAAVRAGSWLDQLVRGLAVTGFSLPSFVFALLLLYIFASKLGWFPVGGYVAPTDNLGGHLSTLVLPTVTVGLTMAGILVRFVYSSMLEVLRADYVRTARSKGVSELAVTFRHALRNASLPLVTVTGLQFGLLVGGMVLVETVFAWPGIGQLMVSAILSRAYNVVQAAVLASAAVFVIVNALVDIAYAALDPRVSFS